MFKKEIKYLILTSLSVAFAIVLFGCVKKEVKVKSDLSSKEEIRRQDFYKVAVAAPQIGPYKALGTSLINGAELAVDLWNEKEGLENKKIKLIKVDDGGLPGEATWRARDLVTQMVLGVIGHLNSDISVLASEIYSKAKIPLISPASTSPLFTEREKVHGYVFRTIGRDDKQGEIAANFVLDKGIVKVAVLYNHRPYGASLAKEFVKYLSTLKNKNEPEIVFYETYMVGKENFNKEISLLKDKIPELVFFIGEYSDASKFLRELKSAGLNTVFLGSDGVFDAELIQEGGAAVEGAFIISSPPIIDKIFLENYKRKFKKEPGAFSATAFDAANILISAVEKTMSANPNEIAKAVQHTKGFNGAIGQISFDDKGDLLGPGFGLYQVQKGMFTYIK